MTAKVISLASRREFAMTERERAIEHHYLGVIARMAEALHKQTYRARRLECRLAPLKAKA